MGFAAFMIWAALLMTPSPDDLGQLTTTGVGGPTTTSATPTTVKPTLCPNSSGQTGPGVLTGTGIYFCPTSQPTLGGNLVEVHTMYNPGSGPWTGTFTVTDDKGDTYQQAVTNTTAASAVQGIYYLANAPAGITQIQLKFSSQDSSHFVTNVAIVAREIQNVATSSPLDGASCNSGTGTSITAGSLTTGTAGDVLTQHVFGDIDGVNGGAPTPQASFTAGSQSGIGWNLDSTDRFDGTATQIGIQAAAGALNATFTQGTSAVWASCAAAFKAASAGTAPTAPNIVLTVHDNPNATASPRTLQFPASGNLQLLNTIGATATITAVTDSRSGCTWNNTGTNHHDSNNNNNSMIWYVIGCAPGTAVLTVTFTGTVGADNYLYYDVNFPNTPAFGNDNGGCDPGAGSVGLVTSLTTVPGGCSAYTPSIGAHGGCMFVNFGQDFETATALTSPANAVFDNATFTSNNGFNGPEQVDQNNGAGHFCYTSSPGAVTVTWTETNDAVNGVGKWSGRAASFTY